MSQYDALVTQAANDLGVPVDFALAIHNRGEEYNPKNPKSPKGAYGPMQVMPGTFADMAAKLGIKDPDIKNDAHNIYAGVAYLGEQLKTFNNNPILAAAAYDSGPGRVQKAKGVPPIKETQDYVNRISDAITPSDPNAKFTSQPLIDLPSAKAGPFDPEPHPEVQHEVFLPWEKIQKSKDYQGLDYDRQMKIKQAWFSKFIAPNPQYQALKPDRQQVVFANFQMSPKKGIPSERQEALQAPPLILNPPELGAVALTGGYLGAARAAGGMFEDFLSGASKEIFPSIWKEAGKEAARWTVLSQASESGSEAGGQVGRAVGGDYGEFIGRALGGTIPIIGAAKMFSLFGQDPAKVKPEEAASEYQSQVDKLKKILSNPKEWITGPKGEAPAGKAAPRPEPTWDELLSKYRTKGMTEDQAAESFFKEQGGMAEAARKNGGVRDWLREQQVKAAAAEKARQEAQYGKPGGQGPQ